MKVFSFCFCSCKCVIISTWMSARSVFSNTANTVSWSALKLDKARRWAFFLFFLSSFLWRSAGLTQADVEPALSFWGSWWDVEERNTCWFNFFLGVLCLFFYLCTVSVPKKTGLDRELQSAYSGGENSSVARWGRSFQGLQLAFFPRYTKNIC